MVARGVKKILITQSQLSALSGSEMITLELAEYFSCNGYEVTILTHHYDYPIKEYFEKVAVNVILTTSDNAESVEISNHDIVWIHHYTMTEKMAEQLKTNSHAKVIYNHMSAWHPLEAIMFPEIEEKQANLILFNSEETMDIATSSVGLNRTKFMKILGNAVPDEFFNTTQPPNKPSQPRKIAIVSNHIPNELREASALLGESGAKVDLLGRGEGGRVERVTPAVIGSYDLIITIGKTVQYAIAAGVPVYCYDWFGGPGYLTEDNYDKAKYYNFSGRGFETKTAKDITHDIVVGYAQAVEGFRYLRKKHADEHRLSTKIQSILSELDRQEPKKIAEIGSLIKYIELLNTHLPSSAAFMNKHKSEIHKVQAGVKDVSNKLVRAQNDTVFYRDRYLEVTNSRAYKLGRVILSPLRAAKKVYGIVRHGVGLAMNKRRMKRDINNIYAFSGSGNRKQRVDLVIRSFDHPTSSAFIRLVSPLTSGILAKSLNLRFVDGQKPKVSRGVDAVVVQRTALERIDDAKALVAATRRAGARLFVDTDDAFSELDTSHPQYELQRARVEALDYVIECADELWVSTERLKLLHGNAARCRVVRNTIDERVWTRLRDGVVVIPEKKEPLHVLYMGTKTHDKDFEVIETALERLHDRYPGEFVFHIVGVASKNMQYTWLKEHQPSDSLYPRFIQWFNELPAMDIGISPLEDIAFNKSKSDIKCLDYLGLGVKPVVSNVEAYSNPELDPFIVRVNNTTDEWYAVLEEELINREKNRFKAEKRINNGYKYIREYRLPEQAAKEIEKSLEQTGEE